MPAIEAPIWEMSASSKIAIAGAGNGIFYSTDRARTWTRATTGLPTQSSGIAFHIQDNLALDVIQNIGLESHLPMWETIVHRDSDYVAASVEE